MKRLIFSDSHLTNELEPKLYDYITKLIKSVDQVIINGDFWESYVINFDEFINSEWSKLFPLLLKKNTIYIYGNHDSSEVVDDQAELFSVSQVEKYQFKAGKKSVTVTHGHHIAPEFDGVFPAVTRRYGHWYPLIFRLSRSPSRFGQIYRLLKQQHYLYNMRRLRAHAQNIFEENELLITGHSHIQVDDRDNGFINLGPFQQGWARYLLIDGSKITLKEERYEKLAEAKK